jgi:branched-chain amino acid transport system permease protein
MGAYATYVLGRHGCRPAAARIAADAGLLRARAGLSTSSTIRPSKGAGSDQGLRGIAFFFGVAFIVQVGLILAFGVDQRLVERPYIGTSVEFGEMRVPQRMLVALRRRAGADRDARPLSVPHLHRPGHQGGGPG